MTCTPSRTSTQHQQHQAAPPDINPQDILKYLSVLAGISIATKLLFDALLLLYILAIPALYITALQQCPLADSFDAKKELKRVLRGSHVPESHPDKPKGFLEKTAARIAASVTTELATLPGYEVTLMDLAGAAIVATVTVPASKLEFYWVGAFGKWHYVTSRELVEDNGDEVHQDVKRHVSRD